MKKHLNVEIEYEEILDESGAVSSIKIHGMVDQIPEESPEVHTLFNEELVQDSRLEHWFTSVDYEDFGIVIMVVNEPAKELGYDRPVDSLPSVL